MAGSIQALIREALDLAKSVVVLEKLLMTACEVRLPSTPAEKELCAVLALRGPKLSAAFDGYDDPKLADLRGRLDFWGLFIGDEWMIVPKPIFERLRLKEANEQRRTS